MSFAAFKGGPDMALVTSMQKALPMLIYPLSMIALFAASFVLWVLLKYGWKTVLDMAINPAARHFSRESPRDKTEFDFVIVGGGSAGCALASRLSENPEVTVLLLEAGGNGLSLTARIPLIASQLQHSAVDWGEYAEPQGNQACTKLKDGRSYWPRGKALGGSSILNYMAYVRGDMSDYESWASITDNEAWDWPNVSSVFKRVEGCYAICNEGIDLETRGIDGPLAIDFKYPRNPIALRFVAAAGALGFAVVDYNHGCLERTVSILQTTTREGARCSAADAYILPVMGSRPNLHVVLNAEVSRIVLNTTQPSMPVATGVKYYLNGKRDAEFTAIAKKEVVVCSSAVGSPKLLMLSGIGPREHLTKMNIPCIVNSPEVGKNLIDHLVLPILIRAHKKYKDIGSINKSSSSTLSSIYWWGFSGIGNLASSSYDASIFYSTGLNPDFPYPDIQIGLICGCGSPEFWVKNGNGVLDGYIDKDDISDTAQGLVLLPTLLHPRSTGSISLKSRDYTDPPVIEPGYLTDERDLDTLVSGALQCVELAEKMSYGEIVIPGDLKHLSLKSKELWAEMARRYATTLDHPSSTCAMGKVLDSELRVNGVQGLRVADASSFPHLTSGNTNAPAILVGEIASDFIKAQYGLKK